MSEETTQEEVKTEDGPLSEKTQLYKHESYTDGELIYLDVMTPMKFSGSGKISVDKDKPKQFIGKSQIEYGEQIMPYSFLIENANNVKEAIDQFDNAMEEALSRTREKIKEMNEQKQKEIVVPDQENKIITP